MDFNGFDLKFNFASRNFPNDPPLKRCERNVWSSRSFSGLRSFISLFYLTAGEIIMAGTPGQVDFQQTADYAEQHDVFRLFQRLLQELVIHKPEDPIEFLIKTLKTTPAPKIVIAGAPASGKGTQCELIVKRFGVVHISTGDYCAST